MTLVVAKKKGNILGLVSDTGIALHGKQLPLSQHIPKIAILSDQLAVAFAGSSELAVDAISSAPKDQGATFGAITQHFLEAHRSNDGATDFIIAFGSPLYKLAKIADGAIRQNRPVEWIGSHEGFEAFQYHRENRIDSTIPYITPMLHTTRQNEMKSPCFEMIGTMRAVIDRTDVQDVFGNPVAASNLDGAFDFTSYGIYLEEKKSFKVPAGTDPLHVISLIEEGQRYSFSCLVNSLNDPMRVVAFHYMHAKITLIYSGPRWGALTNFDRVESMNVLELQEYATARYGTKWIGGVASQIKLVADYGVPISQWRTMGQKRPVG